MWSWECYFCSVVELSFAAVVRQPGYDGVVAGLPLEKSDHESRLFSANVRSPNLSSVAFDLGDLKYY